MVHEDIGAAGASGQRAGGCGIGEARKGVAEYNIEDSDEVAGKGEVGGEIDSAGTSQTQAEWESVTRNYSTVLTELEAILYHDLHGGTGGTGGNSTALGGQGGIGEGKTVHLREMISGGDFINTLVCMRAVKEERVEQLLVEEPYFTCFFQLVGGIGGKGGDGGVDGGGGGTGDAVIPSKRLVSMGKEARYRASRFPLVDLGLDYDVLCCLDKEGFVTIGGLLEVYEDDLKDAGFKVGHICELNGALTAFLEEYGDN
ncbi:hypothetical protein C8R45DRAFT_1105097 [Mycena sanguinolenta]|nr:hypothetical protein C8R45DRAFT_1105097 [Mycena sanguinolenta]